MLVKKGYSIVRFLSYSHNKKRICPSWKEKNESKKSNRANYLFSIGYPFLAKSCQEKFSFFKRMSGIRECVRERAARLTASLTVEAALVLPVFLIAMILIGFIGQMIRCQDEITEVVDRIANEASKEYGATKSSLVKNSSYYVAKMNLYLKKSGLSVSFLNSTYMKENDELQLVAKYSMKLPYKIGPISNYSSTCRIHTRAFTGVENRSDSGDFKDKEVYITPTGRVYHTHKDCTYLKLTISKVFYRDLNNMRNTGGGKYKPCEVCLKNRTVTEGSSVYITNYGDRYHCNRACSGIKRTINSVMLSQVGNRTICGKCALKDGGD